MFGMSKWLLFLGGMQTELYNAKQRMKRPFREYSRKQYQKRYNDENIFPSFIADNRDIVIHNRYYNHIYMGQGAFLYRLIQVYAEKGIRVKLVSTKPDVAHYFKKQYDYSHTEIHIEETKDYDEAFQSFVENDHDVLTLFTPTQSKKNETEFLNQMFQKVIDMPKETDVIYLFCLLYIWDEEPVQILQNQSQIRSIHFDLNDLKEVKKENLNIYIPNPFFDRHETDKEHAKQLFSNVPSWVFEKNFSSYLHFAYKDDEYMGVYFMDRTEKDER